MVPVQVGDEDAVQVGGVAVLLRVELPHGAFTTVDQERPRAPPKVDGAGVARASRLARRGAQESEVAVPVGL